MYEQIASNKRRTIMYIVVFIVVWLAIGAVIGLLIATMTSPSSGASSLRSSYVGVGIVIAAVFALAGIAFSVLGGSRFILATSGALPADERRYRQFHDIVEALAIGEGIPKPALYVIVDPSPNAFATGMSPEHAAITVTTGLYEMMNREELEGVLGHEMSHIKNYDVRLLLIVTTLIGLAGLLASLIWRSAFFMRGRGRNAGQAMIIVFVAGLLLGFVAVIFGPIVRLALSRRREELADVSSVELTRNPAGLISALRKLERNDQPFATLNRATAAMCIDDPQQRQRGFIRRLFDTHPPISTRIAILEEIAAGQRV